MKKCIVVLICFTIFILEGKSQDGISTDNIQIADSTIVANDTITAVGLLIDTVPANGIEMTVEDTFKPNPTRAVIYSAIFPGLGQIYNRKYWKLPIIYGGFIGLSYGFSWNGRYYDDYSTAYRAISAENPLSAENFDKWKGMAPSLRGRDQSTITDSDIEFYKRNFRRKKDYYRRNRDLCIIGAVGVYLVCMVDAYVDAQLFDFDVSPDLSLKVQPTVMPAGNSLSLNNQTLGVRCSLNF